MSANDRWGDDDVLAAAGRDIRYHTIEARRGVRLTHRFSGVSGEVVTFSEGRRVVLRDAAGRSHDFKPVPGAFEHGGIRVALTSPPPDRTASTTRSGSVAPPRSRAATARASRIWVEGVHDAELIEKVWGDDLRAEGIVVEPLHGIDGLRARVRAFGPGPARRLGILVDHLVTGAKEARLASAVSGPDVLVTGHPYVDVWQAIKPSTIGIEAWPAVPRGTPWKEGVIAALGLDHDAGRFWAGVLESIDAYVDLETPLITAVERLIDFVTAPKPAEEPT